MNRNGKDKLIYGKDKEYVTNIIERYAIVPSNRTDEYFEYNLYSFAKVNKKHMEKLIEISKKAKRIRAQIIGVSSAAVITSFISSAALIYSTLNKPEIIINNPEHVVFEGVVQIDPKDFHKPKDRNSTSISKMTEAEFMKKYAPKYLKSIYKDNFSIVNEHGYNLGEVFGLKEYLKERIKNKDNIDNEIEKINNSFWNKYFLKYMNYPIRNNINRIS